MLVKTKTVSRQLAVNPSTIQRWVKHFDLPCKKNNHGHLLFSEDDIKLLKHIQKQLNNGLAKEDVQLNIEEQHAESDAMTVAQFEQRVDELVSRMNDVENNLAKKADEVVTVQLYQHRNELEQLTSTIDEVEERLKMIEGQLIKVTPEERNANEEKKKAKPKKNWLVGLFGT